MSETAPPTPPSREEIHDVAQLDQRDLLQRVIYQADFTRLVVADAPGIDQEKVLRAMRFATDAHEGQMRKSGEPYITHPMGVAALLIKERLDTDSICAALLHDVIEDCDVSPEELEAEFGTDVKVLVQGVTKIGQLRFSSKAQQQAENVRKMMLAMTSDLRVVLIKLADRLHNMATLQHMPVEKQQRIARETLEIYAPIARRLGISKIQWALEDICLRYMNPKVYWDLVRRVAQKRHEREDFVDQLKRDVSRILLEAGIPAKIKGRPKSFYSIYKKTLERDKNLHEVYDLIGLRILVQEVKDCYATLGVIHKTWKPLQGRFKDYIAVPKSNLYQSIHTTVIHPQGHIFEVQIRTFEMDEIAEKGVAAHWAYKENLPPHEQAKRKMTWLSQIIGVDQDTKDSSQFLENVKLDLFRDQVYVFTPKGQVIEMTLGASALDFAYHIHTEVGHSCTGVQVNGKMVPFETELANGDVVSVLTSKSAKGPNRDWLEMVRTSRAQNKIRAFLRKQNKEEYRVRGRELLLSEVEKRVRGLPQDRSMSVQQVLKHEDFQSALLASGFQDISEAALAVGRNDCSPGQILVKVACLSPPEKPVTAESLVRKPGKGPAPGGVLVAGQGDMLVRLSKCCNPVIGDPIVGYITRGRGVSVHRESCPNVPSLDADSNRRVEVQWDQDVVRDKNATFLAEIEVRTQDQPNVLSRVTNVISNFKINISAANCRLNREGAGVLNFSLQIRDSLQLKNLLRAIQSIPHVQNVFRVAPGGSVPPGAGKRKKGKKAKPSPAKGKGGKAKRGRG